MAQPKKTGGNNIVISVKGVEYDNSSFSDLRNAVKGNIKVVQSSPAFTGDAATITLQYNGNATELWDELPQNIKQQFKITSINNSRIDLQLKQNSNNTPAATIEPKKDDCMDCYYYKACSFDTSFEFNGNTYKGYKKRGAAFFCKNGILYSKSYSGITHKQIIFKVNEPAGTGWTDTFGTVIINKMMVAKGIGIMYKKKYYADVLTVYFSESSLTALYYYAKDIGYLKHDTIDNAFNPAVAAKMKGNIDTSLIGTWKLYNDVNKTNYYYQFYGDGTFGYYSGSISKYNQMPSGFSLWRVHDNYIELYNGAWSSVSQVPFKKKNDSVTGKPAIAFGAGNSLVYYVSDDGKPAWK